MREKHYAKGSFTQYGLHQVVVSLEIAIVTVAHGHFAFVTSVAGIRETLLNSVSLLKQINELKCK